MKFEKSWELKGKGEHSLTMNLYRCMSKACNATLRFATKGKEENEAGKDGKQ